MIIGLTRIGYAFSRFCANRYTATRKSRDIGFLMLSLTAASVLIPGPAAQASSTINFVVDQSPDTMNPSVTAGFSGSFLVDSINDSAISPLPLSISIEGSSGGFLFSPSLVTDSSSNGTIFWLEGAAGSEDSLLISSREFYDALMNGDSWADVVDTTSFALSTTQPTAAFEAGISNPLYRGFDGTITFSRAVEEVPAPLPIFAAVAAYRSSRRLRRRIKTPA